MVTCIAALMLAESIRWSTPGAWPLPFFNSLATLRAVVGTVIASSQDES